MQRPVETVDQLSMKNNTNTTAPQKLIVAGPSLGNEAPAQLVVHAAGCADLKRGYLRGAQKYSGTYGTVRELVEDWYGPAAGSFYEEAGYDDPETAWKNYVDEFHLAPCVHLAGTAKATKATATAKAKAPGDADLAKAHAAVVKVRATLATAREALAAATTPAAKTKATTKVERARESLATAMATRQQAMRTYRAAGGRVVDMQRICEFSSSGATLFAMHGSKTPNA